MKIIAAIDLINGQCVRLTKGDYQQKTVYNDNPIEVAKSFEAAGLSYLHLVDLDGAKAKQVVNWKVLEGIAKATNLHIDFSGGIRSADDIQRALDLGAKQVAIGSMAAKQPALFLEWLDKFGAANIILSADAKNHYIATDAWDDSTTLSLFDFIKNYHEKGIEYVTCTDINRDGMLGGVAVDTYRQILTQFPALKLIASGGVSCIADLQELEPLGVEGVIIGKAIYEGRIALEELQELIAHK